MIRFEPGPLAVVGLVCLAGLLSACGSSSQSPSARSSASASTASSSAVGGTSFNSCSVVTRREAASAIGEVVTPGILGTATVEGGLACVFYGPSSPKPANPNVAQTDSVRVVVAKGSNASAWYRDYRSKVAAQAISGYGDEAYYDGYASLSVLKGDSYLRVAVIPAGVPASLPDEKKLAKAILPRL